MRIASGNIEVVFGRGIGHVLEEFLMNANKKIWVMSPWLSERYAEFLVQKKNKGLDVKVFTSNNFKIKSHRNAVKRLLKFRHSWNFKVIGFVFASLAIISLLAFLFWPGIVVFGLLLAPLKNKLKKVDMEKKIDLEVYDNITSLTHAKIYLIDDVAIITSANFTDSGFYKNLEAATIVRDETLVKNLENYFKSLQNNPSIRRVDINKLRI